MAETLILRVTIRVFRKCRSGRIVKETLTEGAKSERGKHLGDG